LLTVPVYEDEAKNNRIISKQFKILRTEEKTKNVIYNVEISRLIVRNGGGGQMYSTPRFSLVSPISPPPFIDYVCILYIRLVYRCSAALFSKC